MAEYIEREATIKAFCESCSDYVNNKCTYEGACEVNIIATVPTADVQPIVYAHKTINVGMRSYCSNCGELAIMENFCSKCGAKVERRKQNG